MSRRHPLELLVSVGADATLTDADKNIIWTSDGDNDFVEFLGADFVEEDDIDEILGYLEDTDKLSEDELDSFENGEFDIIIEEDDPDGQDDHVNDIIEGEAEEL